MKEEIAKGAEGIDLTEEEARKAMDEMLSGEATQAQIAAFLALERMKGNKEAYKAFLAEFFEDPDFIMLQESIEAGNVREAFDCAHGLKGMAANLGLDAIHGALSVLVEILRKGILEGAAEAYEEVMNASNQVKELL